MIDKYNYEIGHRLQHINIMIEITRHRDIIIETPNHNETIIQVGQLEMILNNITVEVTIRHIQPNRAEVKSTHPVVNIIIDRVIDKGITIIEGVTEGDHHEEVCSPTAGRLVMTKEVIEHAKEPKKQ